MAIQHNIWKIGEQPQALNPISIESEELLEEQIFKDISILNANWLLIGRQVYTDFGKPLDLLAIDVTGSLIVIELKKNKTPRDVVAQTIDYASWVEGLSTDKVVQIYQQFASKYGLTETSFDQAFKVKFGQLPSEDAVNSSHLMVVVAAELDASTDRIINYLNDKGIAINAVFFSVFEDSGSKYLSRAWMIDPSETEERAINTGQKGSWNGEFYSSFGASAEGFSWEDACNYGFICAGGGRWYSKTLFMLNAGDRVWVNIPKVGYVGVCEVLEKAVVSDEFIKPDMQLQGKYAAIADNGEDKAAYFVAVKWLKSISLKEAINEVGLFGNQNSVAKPKAEKWQHTVGRLSSILGISL